MKILPLLLLGIDKYSTNVRALPRPNKFKPKLDNISLLNLHITNQDVTKVRGNSRPLLAV
jgi:hypothetical protein